VQALVGVLLITVSLLTIGDGPILAAPPPIEVLTDPAVPVDWHPWFRSGWTFRDFGIDRSRDRVLLTMSSLETGVSNLLVLGTDGTVIANASLNVDPWLTPRLAIDPSSGAAFVTQIGAVVLKIDTLTGGVVDRWTYPFSVGASTVHSGRLYASAPSHPMQILDATTGTLLGSFALSPTGSYTELTVDPNGAWVLGTTGSRTVVRIEIASGATASLPASAGTFANSMDGRVFVCAYGQRGGIFPSVHSFWTENASIEDHGVPCRARIDQNPVTGVLMDAGGYLLRPGGTIGRVLALGTILYGPYPLVDFGWRGDGRALVGVRAVGSQFELGTWDGTPRLARPPEAKRVFDPTVFDFCFYVQSVSGVNESSLSGTFDADAAPLPVDVSESFDCIKVEGFPDGPHLFRLTGWDLLGQTLDDSLEFETDATPPRIELGSSLSPVGASYVLWGWANDSTLESVTVNGQLAVVSANRWSFHTILPIGQTVFRVNAVDGIGYATAASYTVNFWPPYDRLAANATGRFSVPVPPGWVGVPATVPGGSGVTLFEPTEASGLVYVRVISRRDVRATADPQYALDRARSLESSVVSTGGTILERARPVTVAGHPAATFTARRSDATAVQRLVWVVIAVPEWERTITMEASIPEAAWSIHSNTITWILEGFQIETAPETTLHGDPPPIPWLVLLISVGGASAGLLAFVLVPRRKKRPRVPVLAGGIVASLTHR